MKEKIKHLFFDLDRTIWDYETNSRETLEDLYKEHLSDRTDKSREEFIEIFRHENALLWDLFTSNKIDKEFLRKERFYNSILKVGVDNRELGLTMEDHYIDHTPSKKLLIPGAIDTLTELGKHFHLHIITNGFEDVQHFKLRNCGIDHFFKEVITSDGAGSRKPNREIFDFSLDKAGASANESMMIGDDPEVDIVGALNAGWDHAILVNTLSLKHSIEGIHEVFELKDLLGILIK
ncbi:MAG: YjjG family noncanonical pyrimidine nucleotidase [Bacteroidia bacterium]